MLHFDTIVIGSGSSAYFCLSRLLEAGQEVAIIDERPYGGTCALRGCQPKKYLVANAEAIAMTRHLSELGVTGDTKTDWQALQASKNAFLSGRSEEELEDWQQQGVTTFTERGVMTGEDEVTVGDQVLKAKHIVLATGATPRRTTMPGDEHLKTSEDFLELPDLPNRILFVGGGYISFEFANVAAYAGAEVTILHRSKQPLKTFEPDMVKIILEANAAEGIRIVLEESPTAVERTDSGLRLQGSSGEAYESDLIVEATGRVPNVTAVANEACGVAYSSRGITVNEYMQSTTNPNVYAIGDCAASGAMLAPVADEEGKVAGQNIIEENVRKIDYSVVPSAVFTIPNLGSVGLTEAQANEKGLDFRINQGSTQGWASSKRIGEQHGGYKILIDNKSNQLIGAHLARHNASEVINVFALAMKHGISADHLAEFMWAYPTSVSDLKYMVR